MHNFDIGALTVADEGLGHQIADTFATVVESERSWAEKIWGSIARKDGGLQVDFGLGKYINRDVMDAFGGVSRGREQWTVRASRALHPRLDDTSVGPLRYEVIEPLQQVRFVLEPNKVQPVAFDIVFKALLPPYFEQRNRVRTGNRVRSDLIRYHQGGSVSGWIEVDGQRHVLGDDWFAFRDHSWGVRGDNVGLLPPDIKPSAVTTQNMRLLWGPWMMTRPDGSMYEIQSFFWSTDNWDYYSGHVNEADGTQHAIVRMQPQPRLCRTTRYFEGGRFVLQMADGEQRVVDVQALGESGFHLRTGLYGEWAGGRWGSWRGAYHEDGEYIADCRARLPDLAQLRDKPVRIVEGDAVGWGIQESIYAGVFPDLGLDASTDWPNRM